MDFGRARTLVFVAAISSGGACTAGRDPSYEMAVIRALSGINVAQIQYRSAYGRWAATLAELGPPPSGVTEASPAAADLIPMDVARGAKSGYNFTMQRSSQGYTVNADPQVYKITGRRSFFTDQSHVIREHVGNRPASVNDPEIR